MNICILIISEDKRKSSSSNTEQTSIHPLIFIRVTGGGAYPSYTGGEALYTGTGPQPVAGETWKHKNSLVLMRKSNLNCLISYLLCDRRSEVSRGAESAGPRGSSSTGESSTPPDTTSCRRPDPAADPPRKLEGQEVTWLKPAGCSITISYDGSTVFSVLGSVWCHREEKSLYGHQRSPASCLWGTANQKTLFFLFYMYFLF